MSDTPSASSTTPPTGAGAGPGTPTGAAREPRGFAGATGPTERRQAAIDQASSAIAQGVDTATAKMQDAQKWANDQQETARSRIREHPLTAVGVTFGAGMLVGLLLGRR